MFSEKFFPVALLISAAIHGVILSQNPDLSLYFFSQNKGKREVRVSYIRKAEQPKETPKIMPLVRREPLLKLPPKISADKRVAPPSFAGAESMLKASQPLKPRQQVFEKPAFAKTDVLAIKKKITLPPLDTTKIDNPSYINYYQLVRERIKRAAYQNYTGTEVGEVTISFVISADGALKDLHLIEEKSSPSVYLGEIALRSVRDAAPFSGFPRDLDYPQLSFNLAITFEIE